MKKKFSIVIILICTAMLLITCASGGYGGWAASVVKSTFKILDPVFLKNLKPNAAIAVFPISTFDADETEMIYAELQVNIVDSNNYTLVEKKRVDELLQEHDFQRSILVPDDQMVSFGKLLEADAVIVGSLAGKGSERSLSLIAIDMEKRTTLAVANKPWPEGGAQRSAAKTAIPADMGLANVILLPTVGGTDGDNITLSNLINNLRDIRDCCNLINESRNESILPKDFTGFSAEDTEFLYNLGVKNKANFVIHSNVQKYGQRNLAIISRFNLYSKKNDAVNYLEYLDPVEAWVKLPGVISSIMNPGANRTVAARGWTSSISTAGSADRYLWARYADGVDPVLSQQMMKIFISDFIEATGGTIDDITGDIESSIKIRQGVDRYGMNYYNRTDLPSLEVKNRDWVAHMEGYISDLRTNRNIIGKTATEIMSPNNDPLRALFADTGLDMKEIVKMMIIEVSKQGDKTRFQLIGAPFRYSLDFTDMRDFLRQVRGMSLSIGNDRQTTGYDLGIVQGVKYNYWRYADANTGIPDILTYTRPYTSSPVLLPTAADRSTTATAITVYTRESYNSKDVNFVYPHTFFYYSTTNNFSKATPVVPKRFHAVRWDRQEYQDYLERHYQIYGLKPDTQYYVWAANCWGHLLWLQSAPTLFQKRTDSIYR